MGQTKSKVAKTMTFDELLNDACKSAHLPDMARILLPSALSEKTKRKVMRLLPEEFGCVLSTAIETINKGSVESVDALVRKQIDK